MIYLIDNWFSIIVFRWIRLFWQEQGTVHEKRGAAKFDIHLTK